MPKFNFEVRVPFTGYCCTTVTVEMTEAEMEKAKQNKGESYEQVIELAMQQDDLNVNNAVEVEFHHAVSEGNFYHGVLQIAEILEANPTKEE